jgi:transposase
VNHLTGILNHAIHHISTGKVEGTNQLIKTLRRKSYGYRDTEYFFLKIMEASRKNYVRSYKSHTKIA